MPNAKITVIAPHANYAFRGDHIKIHKWGFYPDSISNAKAKMYWLHFPHSKYRRFGTPLRFIAPLIDRAINFFKLESLAHGVIFELRKDAEHKVVRVMRRTEVVK